uniref:Uncharacterized protein n=1 Tax=Esox lucius TaxID=8010 RepID=A0AAY5L0X7_ESOLU
FPTYSKTPSFLILGTGPKRFFPGGKNECSATRTANVPFWVERLAFPLGRVVKVLCKHSQPRGCRASGAPAYTVPASPPEPGASASWPGYACSDPSPVTWGCQDLHHTGWEVSVKHFTLSTVLIQASHHSATH